MDNIAVEDTIAINASRLTIDSKLIIFVLSAKEYAIAIDVFET
jgi:hypothetical protein